MLSVAGEYLAQHNDRAALVMFGQELNPESHAICKADMLIKGQDVSNIVFGNTLSDDGLPGQVRAHWGSGMPCTGSLASRSGKLPPATAGSRPRQYRHASRRRAPDLARRDISRASLPIKRQRAGWSDAFLLSLLRQLANQ